MKTFYVAVLSGALGATSANADDIVSRSYDMTDFEAINVEGIYDLEVVAGEDYSIELSGPQYEMNRVEVSVKNGVLRLDRRDRRRGEKRRRHHDDHDSVDARITLPRLVSFDVSGVVDGDVKGIDADDFDVDISGVGDISLAGSCVSMDAEVSGVGDLDARDLECRTVRVEVSGVGDAEVYASEEVDAEVSGMGDIDVYGSPKKVSKNDGMFAEVNIK